MTRTTFLKIKIGGLWTILTSRNNNPDKIHEDEVKPKVISLGPAVGQVLVVMVKHGGRIV